MRRGLAGKRWPDGHDTELEEDGVEDGVKTLWNRENEKQGVGLGGKPTVGGCEVGGSSSQPSPLSSSSSLDGTQGGRPCWPQSPWLSSVWSRKEKSGKEAGAGAGNRFEVIAEESINAAMRDQEAKRRSMDDAHTVESGARHRLEIAKSTKNDIHERLQGCWQRCLQPTKLELHRLEKMLDDCSDVLPTAEESARRARDVARSAESIYALVRHSASHARQAHESAREEVLFPPLLCDDYGALLRAQHRTREGLVKAIESVKNARGQVEGARAAVKNAVEIIGIEPFRRAFLADKVAEAKRRHKEVNTNYEALEVERKRAVNKEKKAAATYKEAAIRDGAVIIAFQAAQRQTARTRATFSLLTCGRGGSKRGEAERFLAREEEEEQEEEQEEEKEEEE
ncbi:unnamed protein product, partial [Ectocarpus sp. 12 AP-2014]